MRDASMKLILSKQVVHHGFARAMTRCIVSLTMRSVFAHRDLQRSTLATPCASTRFVKWSRCFLHSGVIGKTCTSIRDGTFSIAPSLTWRAQWRNVRRQWPRRLRRRRSALRSGSKARSVFVPRYRAGEVVLRELTFGRGIAGFNVTTEGVGETISGLSDALGLSGVSL